MVKTQHLYTTIAATVQAFFDSYPIARETDPSALSSTLTPDCLRYLRPFTFLDTVGLPRDFAYNNTAYEATMTAELSVTASNGWTVYETVVDAQRLKASALATYHVSLCGTDPIDLELSFYWDFTEDGKQIKKVVEFLDTVPTINESTLAIQIASSGQTC